MTDEAKGEVQIYQFFSECLKLFKKKMVLLCKITNFDDEQLKKHHQSNLNQIIKQASQLLNVFQQIQQNYRNIKPIFSRFTLRIKQSVHNFIIKTSSQEIINFLKYIEKIIKQFDSESKLESLLTIILLKMPKKLSKKPEVTNNYKNQLQKSIIQEMNYNGLKVTKIQNHFDSYAKYIQALDRQYRLFQCLNIQQPHYRKTFFQALEDHRRKDNNLLQDMMNRNRFAKQALDQYQKTYEVSKRKMSEKKQKLKTHINFMINQIKCGNDSSNCINDIEKSIKDEALNFMTAPKRMKTQHLSYNSKLKQRSIGISTVKSFKRSFKSHQFQKTRYQQSKPLKTPNFQTNNFTQQFPIKSRIFNSERQKSRNGRIVPLKKIQFMATKIQLVPEEKQKKQRLISQQEQKKKLYNRTQQHVRKKISFIAQAQVQKLIPYWIEDNSTPSTNNRNFNSIRINQFKIDND